MLGRYEQIPEFGLFPPECNWGSNLVGIKHIFLVKRDFSFSSFADFEDVDTWRDAIKDEDIYPIFRNKQTDNNSEPTKTEISDQGLTYKKNSGKYIFTLYFNYEYEFANKIKTFSETEYDFIFIDLNGNLVGYTPDGVTVKGFDTDLIMTYPMEIGVGGTPNWTKLLIELSYSEQLDQNAKIIKPTWNYLRNLLLVPVIVTEFVEGSLRFKVTDSVYGMVINSLIASDMTIEDDTGAITFTTFQNLGSGYYLLDGFSGALTFGNIVIDGRIYYGSGSYIVTEAIVELSNIVYNDSTSLDFDVLNTADSSLVGGLLVGDFVMTDDTNGVLTINSFTEVSTGRYSFDSLSAAMTTGDIDISSADYTGTGAYDLDIEVEIDNLAITSPITLNLDVTEVISANPLTTLGNSDWVITDDITGTITVTNTNYSGGLYILTLDKAITTGNVAVASVTHSGNANYSFIQANWLNSGAAGATDWLNPTDGVAEYWSQQAPLTYKDASIIVTGGFSGYAQRIESLVSDSGGAILQANAIFFKPGVEYQLYFTYRSDREVVVDLTSDTLTENFTPAANTGNAISYTSTSFTPAISDTFILVQFSLTRLITESGYLEIDNIELIEV